ncbi:hypothetical protein ABZP36_034841 [Zizania latifolia]
MEKHRRGTTPTHRERCTLEWKEQKDGAHIWCGQTHRTRPHHRLSPAVVVRSSCVARISYTSLHARIQRSCPAPHLHLRTSGQQEWSAAPTTLTAATSSSESSLNSRFVLLLDPPVAAATHSEEPSSAAGDHTSRMKPSSSLSSHSLLRCGCLRSRPRWSRGSGERPSETSDEAHAAVPPEPWIGWEEIGGQTGRETEKARKDVVPAIDPERTEASWERERERARENGLFIG